MPKQIDKTGQNFGKLTVLSIYDTSSGETRFLCQCACGNKTIVRTGELGRHKNSCGCLRVDNGKLNKTHGLTKTREYRTWSDIKTRCYNKNHESYQWYGAKGITMCEQWKNSFETFLSDMGKKPTKAHTIERKDVFGDYSPDNCEWATRAEQATNKTTSHKITADGATMCLAEWTRVCGCSSATIRGRIARGWDITKAVTTPPAR